MFDSLSTKLGNIFDGLRGRGVLSEAHLESAMREIRVALLEADVALPVVKAFVEDVKEKAIGQKVIKSVTPSQMVVKIVNDALVETLGGEAEELNLNAVPPATVLMVGLQGSGKTTTSGKLALRLKEKQGKKVLLASLDIYRPAAMEQLAQLGGQIQVDVLPIVQNEKPLEITKRAMEAGKKGGYDVLILDTAGRLHIDEVLMNEVAEVKKLAKPSEVLLVADAMIGQDAVTLSKEFNEKIGVTGIVLTRIDGDGRGGAALSMKSVTGVPIKFMGAGEKMDALEAFHPERIAGRILGMGDVVSLVETAAEKIDQEEAERVAQRMMKGVFNLEDMLSQLRQIKKMGDLGGILGMLPGIAKYKNQIEASGIGDDLIKKQEAIILSMTAKERKNPDLIKASRKQRIANGSGTSVQDVNKLLKQHQQMASVMKKMKNMGGLAGFGAKMMGMGGAMPDMSALASNADFAKMGGSPNPFGGMGGLSGGNLPFGNFNGKFKP